MRNKTFPCIGILCGILSVIFAIILLAGGGPGLKDMDTGTFTSYSYYGGDAYTGIQQAAADTSRNVRDLSALVKAGFQGISGSGTGFILLVLGIWLIAHSLHVINEMQVRDQFEAKVLASIQCLTATGSEPVAVPETEPEKFDGQPGPEECDPPVEPELSEPEEDITAEKQEEEKPAGPEKEEELP